VSSHLACRKDVAKLSLVAERKSLSPTKTISGCRPRAIRVLIAEDEDASREFLAVELERAGFLVCQTANGEECLEQVAGFAPDVIILDLMLPRVSGFAVARAVRALERRRNVPILAVTALASEALRIEALAAGCDGFLRKPILAAVIIEHVGLLLDRPARNLPSGGQP
jgi:DNA-binding response OmpR family regulator